MNISKIRIQNFRKLKDCIITLTKDTTIFVGANNSGKTSAYQAIAIFLKNEAKRLSARDFTLSHWWSIGDSIDSQWQEAIGKEKSIDENFFLKKWREYSPAVDVWLDVKTSEIDLVTNILPTLKWNESQKIGVRLVYEPNNLNNLFLKYIESLYRAKDKQENAWPKSLHDFLNKEIENYFTINAYLIDPLFYDKDEIYKLDDESVKLDKFPFEDLIKVDVVYAQRDISDTAQQGNKNSISKKLKHYYDNILIDIKNIAMSNNEKSALEEIDKANNSLDKLLNNALEKPLTEISENINFPNFSNPSIRLLNNINPIDSLDKASNIQFNIFKNNDKDTDKILLLPEHYNGLGYQNMLLLQIDLLYFADKRNKEENVKPIHLVLIEEPEVHLHVQMQETFIKQAYQVLNKHKVGNTQLVVSTHSSHIANTVEFSNLRYFKRINMCDTEIANSTVIDLSDSFKNNKDAERFANRYLKLMHSDLFFADGVILVEGLSEKLLVPVFVEKLKSLNRQYVTILEVGGSHAHKLIPLLKQLGIPVLIITDIDVDIKNNSSINPTIKNWFKKDINIEDLNGKDDNDKSDENIRLSYQTKINVQPTTFEDALLLDNIDFFINLVEPIGLTKKMQELAEEYNNNEDKIDTHKKMIEVIKKGKKSDLALDLISYEENTKLNAPKYIQEGLIWLEKKLIGDKNE